jgi:hypothetical protein
MYYYKNGKFIKAFKESTTHSVYRLFSLLYTADKRLIAKLLSEFIVECQASKGQEPWDRRANLYYQALLLTNNELPSFRVAVAKVTELIRMNDGHDSYFLSLGTLLYKLSKEPETSFTCAGRNSHLIGDSHTLSTSLSWNFDKAGVTFLPGITIRDLSSRQKGPCHYAIKNAIKVYSADTVVFSVGEIDQRQIYYRINYYLNNVKKTRAMLEAQISSALEFISKQQSPFQNISIMALPKFYDNLVEIQNKEKSGDIEEWINWYSLVFSEIAEKNGVPVVGKEKMENAVIENKIDHAHFKPEFYENFFDC